MSSFSVRSLAGFHGWEQWYHSFLSFIHSFCLFHTVSAGNNNTEERNTKRPRTAENETLLNNSAQENVIYGFNSPLHEASSSKSKHSLPPPEEITIILSDTEDVSAPGSIIGSPITPPNEQIESTAIPTTKAGEDDMVFDSTSDPGGYTGVLPGDYSAYQEYYGGQFANYCIHPQISFN